MYKHKLSYAQKALSVFILLLCFATAELNACTCSSGPGNYTIAAGATKNLSSFTSGGNVTNACFTFGANSTLVIDYDVIFYRSKFWQKGGAKIQVKEGRIVRFLQETGSSDLSIIQGCDQSSVPAGGIELLANAKMYATSLNINAGAGMNTAITAKSGTRVDLSSEVFFYNAVTGIDCQDCKDILLNSTEMWFVNYAIQFFTGKPNLNVTDSYILANIFGINGEYTVNTSPYPTLNIQSSTFDVGLGSSASFPGAGVYLQKQGSAQNFSGTPNIGSCTVNMFSVANGIYLAGLKNQQVTQCTVNIQSSTNPAVLYGVNIGAGSK